MAAFSPQQWADKIRALKAMAEDPALSDEARQNYAAAVADLMTRHGLDNDDLHAARTGQPLPPPAADLWPYAVSAAGGLALARAHAVTAIAVAVGCRCATQHHGPNRPATVAIVGAVADLGTLRELLPLVMRQADLAAATAAANGRREPDYLAGFLTGYGHAVADRITERRADLADNTPGAGIVLASRAEAVRAIYAERVSPYLSGRTAHRPDAAGITAGYAAGRRADLGDSRIGDTTERPAVER